MSQPPPLPSSPAPGLRWRRLVALAFLGGALAWLLHGVPPSTSSWYPPCMLNRLTGWHCPGCGATRAAFHLLHGEWLLAARNNLLFVASLPLTGYYIVRWGKPWVWGRRFHGGAVRPWIIGSLFAAAALFGVLRNLPIPALQWLAPP